MKEREELVELYEIYKDLLTDNQCKYFEFYYLEDYSLSEIADNEDVSRANVSKVINVVEDKLREFERVLEINNKSNRIREIIKSIKEENIKKELEDLL